MAIHKSWEETLSQFYFIETKFNNSSYNKMLYVATLKTMRYISSYIYLIEEKETLKRELKEVRNYYLKMKIN